MLKMRFCLLVGGSLGVALLMQNNELSALKEEKKRNAKELKTLKSDSKEFKKNIQLLNSDDYIEQLARREYFLSKKNEIILVFPEDKND